jgi:hypothetical protein
MIYCTSSIGQFKQGDDKRPEAASQRRRKRLDIRVNWVMKNTNPAAALA